MQTVSQPANAKQSCKCTACQCLKDVAQQVAETSRKIWIGSGEDLYALSNNQGDQNEFANA